MSFFSGEIGGRRISGHPVYSRRGSKPISWHSTARPVRGAGSPYDKVAHKYGKGTEDDKEAAPKRKGARKSQSPPAHYALACAPSCRDVTVTRWVCVTRVTQTRQKRKKKGREGWMLRYDAMGPADDCHGRGSAAFSLFIYGFFSFFVDIAVF